MRILWPQLCFLSAVLLQHLCYGKQPPLPNIILEMLKRNVDWNRDPCDNFYQHVCPISATGPFVTPVPFPQDVIEYIEGLRNASGLELTLRKIADVDVNNKLTNSMANFVGGLRYNSGMYKYLLKELNEKEVRELQDIATPLEKLSRLIEQQVKDSDLVLAEETVLAMLDRVRTMQTAKVMWPTSTVDYIINAYEKFETGYNAFVEGGRNETEAAKLMITILSGFLGLEDDVFNLFDSGLGMNSMYNPEENKHLLLLTALILGLRGDRGIKFGTTYTIAGHEMYHSILTFPEMQLQLWDRKVALNRECYIDHMIRTQDMYRAEENTTYLNSGVNTTGEDLPDYEGLQAAFKLLQQEGGLEEVPYPELPKITRERLFFYSWTATWCIQGPRRISSDRLDPHSLGFLRTNGPFSLLDSFHNAFQCSKKSRMRQLYDAATPQGRCNQIGEVGRRYSANRSH